MTRVRRFVALLLAAAVLPAAVSAQSGKKDPDEPPEIDPYTRNDPDAMKKAGYVKFGNFSIAGLGGGTSQIQEALGGRTILWVETEHFKIGSTLPEYRLSSKIERAAAKRDLKELKRKLPRIKTTTAKLDPWLRLHLYAHRAERHYAEFRRLAGLPESGQSVTKTDENADDLGVGPTLGVDRKFGIMLFEKTTTIGRFYQTFAKQNATDATFFYFWDQPSEFVMATAQQLKTDDKDVENAIHADVVGALYRCLLIAYGNIYGDIPPWLEIGLRHYQARKVNDRRVDLATVKGFNRNDVDRWKWRERMHARAMQDYFPTFEKTMSIKSIYDMVFDDHVTSWSRVDFLMTLGEDKFAKLLSHVKHGGMRKSSDQPCGPDVQKAILKDVYGMTPAEFDLAWRKWVVKNYPAREN